VLHDSRKRRVGCADDHSSKGEGVDGSMSVVVMLEDNTSMTYYFFPTNHSLQSSLTSNSLIIKETKGRTHFFRLVFTAVALSSLMSK